MKADESPTSLKYNDRSVSEPDTISDEGLPEPKAKSAAAIPVIENDHIMNYLKVLPQFRDTLFVSCACCVVGIILSARGL
jgi:hypothetical protein